MHFIGFTATIETFIMYTSWKRMCLRFLRVVSFIRWQRNPEFRPNGTESAGRAPSPTEAISRHLRSRDLRSATATDRYWPRRRRRRSTRVAWRRKRQLVPRRRNHCERNCLGDRPASSSLDRSPLRPTRLIALSAAAARPTEGTNDVAASQTVYWGRAAGRCIGWFHAKTVALLTVHASRQGKDAAAEKDGVRVRLTNGRQNRQRMQIRQGFFFLHLRVSS